MIIKKSRLDYSRLRIMTEEKPRMQDHKPAMVTSFWRRKRGWGHVINIIPSVAWPPNPDVRPTLAHEPLHILLLHRVSARTATMLDNLPLKRTPSELALAGVYGWGLKGMEWPGEMLE